MEIPERVKILGHELAIIFDEEVFARDGTSGTFCGNTKEIRLATNLKESTEAEVLMHELFEAMIQMLQIEMDHKDLSAMSELLFSVIRRNKLDFGGCDEA